MTVWHSCSLARAGSHSEQELCSAQCPSTSAELGLVGLVLRLLCLTGSGSAACSARLGAAGEHT